MNHISELSEYDAIQIAEHVTGASHTKAEKVSHNGIKVHLLGSNNEKLYFVIHPEKNHAVYLDERGLGGGYNPLKFVLKAKKLGYCFYKDTSKPTFKELQDEFKALPTQKQWKWVDARKELVKIELEDSATTFYFKEDIADDVENNSFEFDDSLGRKFGVLNMLRSMGFDATYA